MASGGRQGSLRRWHLGWTVLCTLLIVGSVAWGYVSGAFRKADYTLYDLHFKWRGPLPTSGKVVLVLIDSASRQELQQDGPEQPRQHLAAALDHLCAAGTEIIGVDLILAAPSSDPAADQALAHAMDGCNNLVLARVSAIPGMAGVDPLPLFQEAMIGDGFIDVPLDEDGVLRKIRFFNAKPLDNGQLQLLPSFSLELVRTFFNLSYAFDFRAKDFFTMGEVGERQLRLPYPELLINYFGNYQVFPHLSYRDVVAGRFPAAAVQGKIVLIGSADALKKDFFVTSFSRFAGPASTLPGKFKEIVEARQVGRDLGVACHANAIETILSGRFLHAAPRGWVLLAIGAAGGFGCLCYLSAVSWWLSGLAMLFCAGAVVGGAHLGLVQSGVWLEVAPAVTVLCGQFVAGTIVLGMVEKRRKARVAAIFGRYVSPKVVDLLLEEDIEATLEGQRQELTILFSDIRAFTSLSERLGAQETARLLNEYFGALIPVVFAHQGTLDKLIGDAIMAFFGSPVTYADHPVKAAEAALAMVSGLEQLQEGAGERPIKNIAMGIGLNTGEATVGNLGSREFMNFTVIGDAVNLASRLEGMNKVYGTNIVVSDRTAAALDERFLVRKLDRIRVKGKDEAITIYELMGYRTGASAARRQLAALFDQGVEAYGRREWDTAEALFQQGLAEVVKDPPSVLYLERIERYRQNPPPEEWDGVTVYQQK